MEPSLPEAVPSGPDSHKAEETSGRGGIVAWHFGVALFCFFSAYALWGVTPSLVGVSEPIDAGYPLLSGWLFLTGFLVGIFSPRPPMGFMATAWFATVLGQTLAVKTLPHVDNSWWLLGLVVSQVTSLLIIPGIVVGFLVRVGYRACFRRAGG